MQLIANMVVEASKKISFLLFAKMIFASVMFPFAVIYCTGVLLSLVNDGPSWATLSVIPVYSFTLDVLLDVVKDIEKTT